MLVHGVKGGVWDQSCRAHTVLDNIPSTASIIPKMQMMRGSGGTIPLRGGGGLRGPGTGTYIYIYLFIYLYIFRTIYIPDHPIQPVDIPESPVRGLPWVCVIVTPQLALFNF